MQNSRLNAEFKINLKEFAFILAHGIKEHIEIGNTYTQNGEISSFFIHNNYLNKKYRSV